jgi:hypothetical protein
LPEALTDGEHPFDPSVHLCAVVICRTEHHNLHVGLLHRSRDGSEAVLHLGWLNDLDLSWPWSRLWVCPDAEPEKLRSAAGHCRRIWSAFQKNQTFPYALGDFTSSFDTRGALVLAPGAKGLTCATFVMAVFRAAGVELVVEEGWPIRIEQDNAWIEQVASLHQTTSRC